MTCSDTARITGQHLLFMPTSTASWTFVQFAQAAQFAKAHGIDALILKVADGAYRWYGGMDGYRARRGIIKGIGVGVIPYTYSYGDKYNALDIEIDILASFTQEDGIVCADMEQEWNGQTQWAQHLCGRMQGLGTFLVSTWADPSLQNWEGVIQALNPCVNAWMPQQYSNYLGTFWDEFGANGAACLQPTLDMTQDFGTNDPVALAAAAHDQGHTAISIWHYDTAVANPGLLDQILAAFPKTQEEQPMTIPTGWTDDGTTLKAPNNIPVVLGFRDHVLTSNWDKDNWPLEPEQHLPILEQSNPGLGAGQRQIFRLKSLEYTPKMGVFEGWIGQELQWYQKQHALLQAQVATLQAENDKLKALLASSNLGKIGTLCNQIVDDVALITKLVSVQ